jgi:hypothetical protein
VPARARRLQSRQRKTPLAGISRKPSDGLEPSTPSLPWRFRGGNGGHGRARVVTFFLQIEPWRRVVSVRECPRVLGLMYPSRTCVLLSARKTENESDPPDHRPSWSEASTAATNSGGRVAKQRECRSQVFEFALGSCNPMEHPYPQGAVAAEVRSEVIGPGGRDRLFR